MHNDCRFLAVLRRRWQAEHTGLLFSRNSQTVESCIIDFRCVVRDRLVRGRGLRTHGSDWYIIYDTAAAFGDKEAVSDSGSNGDGQSDYY